MATQAPLPMGAPKTRKSTPSNPSPAAPAFVTQAPLSAGGIGGALALIEKTSPGTDFTSPLSGNVGSFVLELAAQLQPLDEVLAKYDVDQALFQKLLKNRVFREMVVEAERSFKALTNTAERIRIKAQLLIELGLDELYSIIVDHRAMASARVQAFTAIRALTGLEKPEAIAPAQKFNLTISLPHPVGGPEVINVTGSTIDPDPEEEDDELPAEEDVEEEQESPPIGDPPSDAPVTSVRAVFAEKMASLGVGVSTPIQIVGNAP